MDVGQIAPRRLADTIVEQLETMILEGTLQPGERLPPERVCLLYTSDAADE